MKDKLYYLIPVLHVLLIVYSIAFFITETNDSNDYYNIADSLPAIHNSMFPILYPLFLKSLNSVFNEHQAIIPLLFNVFYRIIY